MSSFAGGAMAAGGFHFLSCPWRLRLLWLGLDALVTEAARSTGANWLRTITSVIVPVIRGSVMATVALTFALSLGEYTLTVLLHWDTFPTWVTYVAQDNLLGAIAISMMSLILPFVILTGLTLLTPERSSQGGK